MKHDFRLPIRDRYNDPVAECFFIFCREICHKAGQGGFPDQLLHRKLIRLQQETGGGHLFPEHIVPEPQSGAKKEVISVQPGKGEFGISRKLMIGRNTYGQIFFQEGDTAVIFRNLLLRKDRQSSDPGLQIFKNGRIVLDRR